MLKLKRNTLSVALASAILAAAGGVQAQEAAADDTLKVADPQEGAAKTDEEKEKELEAVTVLGIRGSIERSINLKVDSDSIVEAISSEDIGKLPDISIADSITRLPGLAAQRVAGRSSTISIRGFSGDYGTTLLNGREQVSVGDNRTVEFDQYPSELINQVVVYKTADASLVGQGLSGTIDLRTVRPLMFQERVASVNVRGEKNSLGEINEEGSDYGNRISAFYVDQFMDGNLGIALGYARLDSPGQAQRYEAWGYPTDIPPFSRDNPSFTLGGAKLQGTSTDNVRQGFMGVLEYNASENWSTTLDIYYSQFDKAETTRFMEVGLGWGGGVSLTNPTSVGGVTTAGTFNNIRPVLRNDLNEGDDKLFAIGWNNVFTINEDWSSTLDLSYSSADREESLLETYAGTTGARDSVQFVLNPSAAPRFTFSRDYREPAPLVLGDPGGWGQDGYIKTPQIDDELRSVRLDFTRSFTDGMFTSVEFGVNFSDREKQRSVPEAFLDLLNNRAPVAVDPSLIVRPVNLGHVGLPGTLSYNIPAAFDRYYRLRTNINTDILNKQWTVSEEITTGFIQANLNTEVFGIPVRGNLGFQAVAADQSSRGFALIRGNAANATPVEGGDDYVDYLPSLNLVFDLGNEWVSRFGAGRTIARPRVDQMRANINTDFCPSCLDGQPGWTRNGGNPELRPWEANAFDLSIEKYFAERGYVSLAYFYKDLRSYIFDQILPFDATPFGRPADFTGPPLLPVGEFTAPANGEGGNIKGWEFAVSIPFDIFTDALEGFGIQGNHSDTSSSIKRLGPDGPNEPIAGLSEKVTNISLYYENYGFQARVGQRKRSDFLGEIQGFGADRALVYIDGESVTDVQIGYTFQEGSSLEGLSILLQVNNVTDEPYRQFFPASGLTQRYEEYGRQYLLGATYRF